MADLDLRLSPGLILSNGSHSAAWPPAAGLLAAW